MRKFVDEYLPIILLYGMGAYFLTDIEDFTPDSLLYPAALAWVLIVLTTFLLIATLLKKITLPKDKEEYVLRKFWIIFFFSIIYAGLVPWIGFTLASMLYCPTTILALGYHRKGLALMISLVTIGLIYAGFKLVLKVPLPSLTIGGFTF